MKHTILYLSLALTALSSCSKENEAASAEPEAEELPVIETSVAEVRDVEQTKSYTANIEAFNSNNISPATMNRIKGITVDVGDHVRRGQTVVTLDNSSAVQLKVNLDQIKRELDRANQLLQIGSGTQAAVDQLKAQYDAAQAQYNNVVENTMLTAPVSGVVTARNYDPGDMTGSLPVLTVGQITPNVKVIINVAEIDRAEVKTGMPVSVTLDAFPEDTIDARISRIYPAVDPSSRTFQAEVQIPNAGEKIFPGMFARVKLNHGSKSHVVVPDRAIVKQTGSGNRYVYVFKDGKVSFRKVELGRRLDDAYELLSGIADGDSVVISGQSRLSDGAAASLKK